MEATLAPPSQYFGNQCALLRIAACTRSAIRVTVPRKTNARRDNKPDAVFAIGVTSHFLALRVLLIRPFEVSMRHT